MNKLELLLGITATIIGLLSLLYATSVLAMEYTSGENLTVSVTNATNGTIITNADCNMTITNSSGVQINGHPMNNSGDGTYFWIISGIGNVPTEKYLAKANCSIASREWTAWEYFVLVDEYTPNVTSAILADTPMYVWTYATRTLSSFGTLVADIWAYATRTLSNWGEIPFSVWNFTEGRNSTYVSITNATQQQQLENSTGSTYNTYDNSTLNVILPADAI